MHAAAQQLTLLMPDSWFQQHTVLAADLRSEQQFIKRVGLSLICPGLPELTDEI